ncbi:MAG: glycosyltransferase [Deltaproteobacteria bacterium]|nr:glycosyltransferase [Deltaproteobacteria bacterium]
MKTRLTPVLSSEQAAAFYDAMLADVLVASLDFARRLELEPFLHFDPPEAREELAVRAPQAYALVPQRGPGLAERMANAFSDAFEARGAVEVGCPALLLRGSDSPGLDFETVEEALTRLEAGADLVLTPDQGGGYALIGMKNPHPSLFELTLSTESVLDETLDRARALGLAVAQTRPSFDLDVPADLARLDALPPARSLDLCPRTVRFRETLHRIGVL